MFTLVLFFALRSDPRGDAATAGAAPLAVAPAIAPSPVVTPLEPRREAEKKARVHVTGTAGAEILVDGKVVGNVPADLQLAGDATRSEERRVGKECRSRGAP